MRGGARRARGGFASRFQGTALLGLHALFAWSARVAFAQIPAQAAGGRTLDVTIVRGGDEAAPLLDTIRELVGRLGLGVIPHRVDAPGAQGDAHAEGGSSPDVASGASAGLTAWVDLGSRYEIATVVRNGNSEVRRTIPRDASPAVVREEVGEAVRSAVESQLIEDGRRIEPATPAPPPPPASVAPEAPVALPMKSVRAVALDVTTVAGAGALASGSGPEAHVGGGVILASRRGLHPSVSLTAEYAVPFDVDFAGVTSRASLVSLRAVPAVEIFRRSWLAVDLGAGFGLDLIRVDASSTSGPPAITVNPQVPTGIDPVLVARATAYVGLTPGVVLTLIAGGDLDLASLHYVVDGSTGATNGGDLLVPWRVRPTVLAGFTFTALGSGLFATRGP